MKSIEDTIEHMRETTMTKQQSESTTSLRLSSPYRLLDSSLYPFRTNRSQSSSHLLLPLPTQQASRTMMRRQKRHPPSPMRESSLCQQSQRTSSQSPEERRTRIGRHFCFLARNDRLAGGACIFERRVAGRGGVGPKGRVRGK